MLVYQRVPISSHFIPVRHSFVDFRLPILRLIAMFDGLPPEGEDLHMKVNSKPNPHHITLFQRYNMLFHRVICWTPSRLRWLGYIGLIASTSLTVMVFSKWPPSLVGVALGESAQWPVFGQNSLTRPCPKFPSDSHWLMKKTRGLKVYPAVN